MDRGLAKAALMGTCMRKAFILSLIWLTAVGVATAQDDQNRDPQGQARLNRSPAPSQSSGNNSHNNNSPPPPPPIPRCADLAVTTLGFATAIPGGAPLAAGEVALQYD